MHISTFSIFIIVLLKDAAFKVECVKINQFSDSERYKKEENLLNDLLTGYNPLILPTPNNSESVKVQKIENMNNDIDKTSQVILTQRSLR